MVAAIFMITLEGVVDVVWSPSWSVGGCSTAPLVLVPGLPPAGPVSAARQRGPSDPGPRRMEARRTRAVRTRARRIRAPGREGTMSQGHRAGRTGRAGNRPSRVARAAGPPARRDRPGQPAAKAGRPLAILLVIAGDLPARHHRRAVHPVRREHHDLRGHRGGLEPVLPAIRATSRWAPRCVLRLRRLQPWACLANRWKLPGPQTSSSCCRWAAWSPP